jgi:uncharacterized protein (DUF697 family)
MQDIKVKEQSLKEILTSIVDDPSIPETKKIDVIIHLTSLTCAVVAVQPIPFADLFILSPIQVVMVIAMSRVLGNPVGKNGAGEIVASIAGVVGWGVLAQQAVLGLYKTVIPFMGGFTTIPLVYGATMGLGYGAKTILEARKNDQSISDQEIKRIQREAKEEAKTNNWEFNNIIEELNQWKNKAKKYQQYCEKLEKQQKEYEHLIIQNKYIFQEYQSLQNKLGKIEQLETEIEDYRIKINQVTQEKDNLKIKLNKAYNARLELEEKLKNTHDLKIKLELEAELKKRIEAEQFTQFYLDEALKLEDNLRNLQRDNEVNVEKLKAKDIEIQEIEKQLNNLNQKRCETLKERFSYCYSSLVINDKILTQILKLDSLEINLLERQFGLLENTLDKVTFSKTINYRGVNVQEIDCNCDLKLYVKIENNRIFISKIGYGEWNIICSERILDYCSKLNEKNKIKLAIAVNHLEEKGVNLAYPDSSKIKGTNFNLRELRVINNSNEAIRIFYTFTMKKMPILLWGGNKHNYDSDDWYKKHIKIAEKEYINYLNNPDNVSYFDDFWSNMSLSARQEAMSQFMIL